MIDSWLLGALRERLAAVAAEARFAWIKADPAASVHGRDELETAACALRSLDTALKRMELAIAEEAKRRHEAEDALRQSEERYALAVRGANDGMMEWSLRSNLAYYSPRWKSMLGYSEEEIGSGIHEWLDRVHPDDRGRVQAALDAHIAGRTERFEIEHRVRKSDGAYRWILARAALVRSAAGRPHRLIGLHTDVTARHRAQETLIGLADALSGLRGEQFFQALVQSLADVIGAREAFVCECADFPTTRVRMLAHWNRGEFGVCPEFDLAGTPCEDVVIDHRELYVPRGVSQRWPLEKAFERESYLGLPCIDSSGRVIGHVACADSGEMPDELPHYAILKLFAVRAAIELERRQVTHEPIEISVTAKLH
ncbi:MAG: PAS domain-containing protein [Burkholderiales bacterium]